MSFKYCGFCHTDVHLANNDWKLPGFEYPAVVGHEIAGIVTKAGENVKAIILIRLASACCAVARVIEQCCFNSIPDIFNGQTANFILKPPKVIEPRIYVKKANLERY